MAQAGLLTGAAHFPFHNSSVAAPLSESEAWRYGPLSNYNRATTENFAAIADRVLGDFDLVDCGAHLGLFTAQFATFSRNCRRITAIEPNTEVFAYLEGNLRAGRVQDIATLNAAIGDFTGRGRLCAPDYDPTSNHALYLTPDETGPIDVIRLDSLAARVGPRAAIKLDIEGHELAVLRSSADFIRSRDRVVLCVELHRKVLDRVGQTDTGLLAAINGIRPMIWVDADHPETVLDLSRPVWQQIGNDHQGDVIGWDA
jgi:FkbM family methyltransferase